MAMNKALALGLLVLAFVAVTALGYEDEVPAGNQQCDRRRRCGGNLCCSKYGFCGSTAAYCGVGCQSGPCRRPANDLGEDAVPLANQQCNRRRRCPNNNCCSRFGFCGISDEYCGVGCQSGPCRKLGNDLGEDAVPLASNQQCDRRRRCGGNLCCSKYGFCGSTAAYCGVGCQSGPCRRPANDLSEDAVWEDWM